MQVMFEGELEITPLSDREFYWRVVQPYTVRCGDVTVRVPAQYVTDLASVPRALWAILPPSDGHIVRIAPAHDYLYESHEQSRATADLLLYWGMIASGAPTWKAWGAYCAVRIGGQSRYDTVPTQRVMRQACARPFVSL